MTGVLLGRRIAITKVPEIGNRGAIGCTLIVEEYGTSAVGGSEMGITVQIARRRNDDGRASRIIAIPVVAVSNCKTGVIGSGTGEGMNRIVLIEDTSTITTEVPIEEWVVGQRRVVVEGDGISRDSIGPGRVCVTAIVADDYGVAMSVNTGVTIQIGENG